MIRTEASYIDGQVTLEGYRETQKELGLKYYIYDAFLDNRTSAICEELNGKHFLIDEAEVGVNYPPMHPNCRSTTQLELDEDYKIEEKPKEEIKENIVSMKNELINEDNIAEKIRDFSYSKEIDDFIKTAKEKHLKLSDEYVFADKKRIEYNRKWLLENDTEAKQKAEYWFKKGQDLFVKKRDLQEETAKELFNILNKEPNTIKVRSTSTLKNMGSELERYMNKIVNKKMAQNKTLDIFETDVRRSYFNSKENVLYISDLTISQNKTSTLLHEAMHWLEHNDKNVLNKSVAFFEYRTKGEKVQKLSDLTGIKYDDNEIAKKDNFFNAYCGKIYKNTNNEYYATEILSMGLQEIYENPIEFYDKDKEYFNFVISLLMGKL